MQPNESCSVPNCSLNVGQQLAWRTAANKWKKIPDEVWTNGTFFYKSFKNAYKMLLCIHLSISMLKTFSLTSLIQRKKNSPTATPIICLHNLLIQKVTRLKKWVYTKNLGIKQMIQVSLFFHWPKKGKPSTLWHIR